MEYVAGPHDGIARHRPGPPCPGAGNTDAFLPSTGLSLLVLWEQDEPPGHEKRVEADMVSRRSPAGAPCCSPPDVIFGAGLSRHLAFGWVSGWWSETAYTIFISWAWFFCGSRETADLKR